MEFEITLFLNINAICYPNYFMDSENKAVSEKADDFGTLETFTIHKTRYSEVFAKLVTITDKLYVLFRKLKRSKNQKHLSSG